MSETQIVVFVLNGEECGAEASQVKQIIKYQNVNIAKMPKMPDYVDGILNLRGNAVPVINLNRKFELGDAEITNKTKILITEKDGRYIGFMVNDVSELMKLSDGEIESTPEVITKTGNLFLKSVGLKGERILSIIDLHNVLTENEFQNIKQDK